MILIFLLMSCTLFGTEIIASETHQLTSYAEVEDELNEVKPISTYVMPSLGRTYNNKASLASTFSFVGGLEYHVHKNIGINFMSGIELNSGEFARGLQNINSWYVPFVIEGRLYPVSREITPFVSLSLGTIISEHLGFFGSKGIGLQIHSGKNRIEIYFRQIHGNLFLMDTETPIAHRFQNNSLQVSFRTYLR